MVSGRVPLAVLWATLSLGCQQLTGLDDLEKVDCVENCPGQDGGGGSGGVTATDIGVGRKTSCTILSDGTMWCWGTNPGTEPGTPSSTPVRVSGLTDMQQMAIGAEHTCALDGAGTVWCWGRNDSGQLGTGDTTPSNVPKPVPNLPVIDTVGAGESHTCAFTNPDNPTVDAYCWGNNAQGQIGDGTTENRPVPTKLTFADGAKLFRLSPGAGYTCAIVEAAGAFEARCWGKNDKGQCGQDPVAMPIVGTPTAVTGLPAVERVYSGWDHVCARTVGTRLAWCWGANTDGQIGIGVTSPVAPASEVVGGISIDTMSAGLRHSCLLQRETLTAYCWGANDLGQFSGSPTAADEPSPMEQAAISGIAFSMRQAEHGCGLIEATGGVRCWGANDQGQIGNGKTGPYSAPVDLTFGQ